ncbi:cell division protein FtsZ [Erythrobacter crassostreae]|uniref:Cell division protein FtsZ n=1 Tax=Erythrobacter crassostreae TaxID=2828328 RepID=A0A9X1JME3_9SPHN|nr:cell division protein FtsZ [Erythrobacter crassostrea]MBV7259329.1 cell division protein FtsZ [Erythrobacter crassostrea]
MSINIGPAVTDDLRPRITVVGIGGAGGNAIANMIASEIEGVEFIVANTDAQALSSSPAEKRIQLGPDITGGLGAGARPEVGKAAAEETVAEVEEALEGVNMVFIAAGMGGGTGTGAAPVIAEAARRRGVLTVGVVTKPFLFEGTRRMRAAEAGIAELQEHVDTLIVIPNQNLFLVAKAETTFKEAFELADEVLQQGVRSITDLMVMPGLINLDFADVRSVMSEMGKAMMGTGEGEGETRALDAAEQAIANPLLDGVSMQGAKGVIISIIGGEDMKLLEVDEAANHIRELVDEDANIIWGSAFNADLDGKIRVSVVATGIEPGAIGHAEHSTPVSLSSSRAPKRPVLELPEDNLAAEEPATEEVEEQEPLTLTAPDMPEFEAEPELEPEEEPEAANEAEPFDLSGMQAGDDMGETGDDVDGIVDPLAGLRDVEEEPYDLASAEDAELADPADDSHYGVADDDGFASEEGTLDLTGELSEGEGTEAGDDVLADADRLADEDKPVEARLGGGRRRGLLGGASGGEAADGGAEAGSSSDGAASGGGSTLFERMANLSRSGSDDGDSESDDEDKDGDDAPALSIPRFLGRQNNQ